MRFHRALLLTCALVLGACSKPAGSASQGDGEARVPGGGSPLRLALVTDVGGLGDKSSNAAAYAGLVRAKTKLGAEIQVLESKSPADYQPNLTVLADEDFDEVFAIGSRMRDDLEAIARLYPRRRFTIVDAVVDQANVTSFTFREQEGSFLAGALAAMMSKTKMIGFLGGADLPRLRKFQAGFAAGAREVDPKMKVLDRYVGSFQDVAAAKERAGTLLDGGADIIYVAAGKAGLGAIDEVRSRSGAFAIGVDSDQDALAPGKILTSVVKRFDLAVWRSALETQALKQTSGTIELGLENEGVSLTDFKFTRSVIGPARLARLAKIRHAIVEGKITPPKTRAELAAFGPVAL